MFDAKKQIGMDPAANPGGQFAIVDMVKMFL